MITDVSSNTMQDIIQRWFDAPHNLKTNGRIQLYADTEQAVTFVSKGSREKITELCTLFFKDLKLNEKNSENLALWIAHHTLQVGPNERDCRGAYPSINNLFDALLMNCSSFIQEELKIIETIKSKTLEIIETNKRDFLQIKDIKTYILPQSVKELYVIKKVSLLYKEIANNEIINILINQLNGEQITLDDLKINCVNSLIDFFGNSCSKILNLNLENFDLEDLSFLKYFPSLKNLNLYLQPKIQDFSFLKYCPELTKLNLSKCLINDLSFLKDCPQMTDLDLTECLFIKDFSFLNYCSKLTKLNLNKGVIDDLNFLKNFQLTDLNLTKCLNINDFSFIQYCPNLTILDLSNCSQIKNLNFSSECLSLTNLDLFACKQFNDLNFLKFCPNIIKIHLSTCIGITDFRFLKVCPFLEEIDLSYCQIEDFTFLQHCPSLKTLITFSKHGSLQVLRDKGISIYP